MTKNRDTGGHSLANMALWRYRYDVAMVTVTPFLWFNDNAQEALDFYSKVFSNSEIVDVTTIR